MPGRFISLEGGEGVGKSTQAALLVAALEERGRHVVRTREPGGSAGAETIRTLLLTGGEERWGPRAEALLFAAARADHVATVIRPALDAGAWVVCDRYVDSSRAYQGAGNRLGDETILTLHRLGSKGFMPHRTLILDLPDEQARHRAHVRDAGQADRIGGRSAGFHRRVAGAFRAMAMAEPERCRLIDASADVQAVHRRIVTALADLL